MSGTWLSYRTLWIGGFCLCICLWLVACGGLGQPLLSNVEADPATLQPSGEGETVNIQYTIGCDARVTIFFEGEDSTRYTLRSDEPRKRSEDPYVLRFDGTVLMDNDPMVKRKLLPQGTYTAVIQAESERCGSNETHVPITIANNNVAMPDIENLMVFPTAISPNADAIDDVTEITYRLPVTATVDINITTPSGQTMPFVTRDKQTPAEWSHVWNGKRPDGALLPNGVYTYTITAEDRYGNIVQRQGSIELIEVGQPEATITYASIAPRHIMLGRVLTITMRVKNTGPVPIRTYGPPSGYTYTTNEVYSSIEDERYTARSGGFWRIGADWDANSGDGPRRYPFRWALTERDPQDWKIPGEEDWLMPGEEVEIMGHVKVLQRETRMGFYVGLIQDGVGFFQNRTARTIVEVGF